MGHRLDAHAFLCMNTLCRCCFLTSNHPVKSQLLWKWFYKFKQKEQKLYSHTFCSCFFFFNSIRVITNLFKQITTSFLWTPLNNPQPSSWFRSSVERVWMHTGCVTFSGIIPFFYLRTQSESEWLESPDTEGTSVWALRNNATQKHTQSLRVSGINLSPNVRFEYFRGEVIFLPLTVNSLLFTLHVSP